MLSYTCFECSYMQFACMWLISIDIILIINIVDNVENV